MISLACQKTTVRSSNSDDTADKDSDSRNQIEEGEHLWVPDIIKTCIAKAVAAEPIEIETMFNPYYLRAHLEGNKVIDYVVLVRSVAEKKRRSVLICKDSASPTLLGPLANTKESFSQMNNDNFVTKDWEILSNEETRTVTTDSGNKIGTAAKGESVSFIFEGGSFFIYWNGTKFRGVGGA